VQLREVARRARTGLGTIYKRFPTREALIAGAVERWMALNVYATVPRFDPQDTLHASLMTSYRHVFEPWERSPRMLEAFHRARFAPGGDRLDPDYVDDVSVVLTTMAYAVVGRLAEGSGSGVLRRRGADQLLDRARE
jgi:AcrR family transcriptional regulator